MAEPISLQQLKDASEDAISLSEFVNEDEYKSVPRRLALPINTLDYYIKYFKAWEQVYTQPNGTVTVDGKAVKSIGQIAIDAESIVNDAINNTAVEGGVLADTFVTATAKFGGVARTQASKNEEVASIKDFSDITSAESYALTRKGRLYVPAGSHTVTNDINPELYWGFGDIVSSESGKTFSFGKRSDLTPYSFGAVGDKDDAVITDDTEALQKYLDYLADNNIKDAPLHGKFRVGQLILNSRHDGLHIHSGHLKKIKNPPMRNVSIVAVGTLVGADTTIEEISFSNIIFEAEASYTGDFNVDDPVNYENKHFCSGISLRANPAARVRCVNLKNIHGISLGNSLVGCNGIDYVKAENITGYRVNKHVFGSSVTYFGAISTWATDFNPIVEVVGINAVECGTSFDLSTVGSSKEDYGNKSGQAKLTNIHGTDLSLRTKIHGFWEVQISNMSSTRKVYNSAPIAPYSGLDVANSRIKSLIVTNMNAEGVRAAITANNRLQGEILLNNIVVKDCILGISTEAPSTIINTLITDGVYSPISCNSSDALFKLNDFSFSNSSESVWLDKISEYIDLNLSIYPISITAKQLSIINGNFTGFGEASTTAPSYIGFIVSYGSVTFDNIVFDSPSPNKHTNGFSVENRAEGASLIFSRIIENTRFVTDKMLRVRDYSGVVNKMVTLTSNNNIISKIDDGFAGTLSNSGNFWTWIGTDSVPRYSTVRPVDIDSGSTFSTTP